MVKTVQGVGRDLRLDYVNAGATRDGRELVLPAGVKLPTILAVQDAAHQSGLSFGVADNEFQYLSDTGCCCSGVDQFPGFEGWFKHQVAHAVRRCRSRDIVYGAISGYWAPEGSVDRWLNSHSRIDSTEGNGGTLKAHIRLRWNDPTSPLGPGSFFGVEPTGAFTPAGLRIYRWREDARSLCQITSRPPRDLATTGQTATPVDDAEQPIAIAATQVRGEARSTSIDESRARHS